MVNTRVRLQFRYLSIRLLRSYRAHVYMNAFPGVNGLRRSPQAVLWHAFSVLFVCIVIVLCALKGAFLPSNCMVICFLVLARWGCFCTFGFLIFIFGMAQSLSQVYIHAVFHVSSVSVAIRQQDVQELHAYIGGVIKGLSCAPIAVNGMPDHVHMLVTLSRNITISDLVRQVKTASHKFLSERAPYYQLFNWQRGYGVFSVSKSNVDKVEQYIQNQLEHHAHVSARMEFEQMLTAAGLSFDSAYLWD